MGEREETMARDGDREQPAAVFQQGRNTPMPLDGHCITAMEKLEETARDTYALSDSNNCPAEQTVHTGERGIMECGDDREQLAAAFQEGRNTPMPLGRHCIRVMERLGKTIEGFYVLPDSLPGPAVVYVCGKNSYKVSIPFHLGQDSLYEHFAFALLIIKDDRYGQLVDRLSGEGQNREQLFCERQSTIKELAEVLKHLPLCQD